MQGIILNLVTVGRRGITSPGKVLPAKVMECRRPFSTSGMVVRTLDGKFRKWNPVVVMTAAGASKL